MKMSHKPVCLYVDIHANLLGSHFPEIVWFWVTPGDDRTL